MGTQAVFSACCPVETAAFPPGTWDQFAGVRDLGPLFSAPLTVLGSVSPVPALKSLPKPQRASAFLSDSHSVDLSLEWAWGDKLLGDSATDVLSLQNPYLLFSIPLSFLGRLLLHLHYNRSCVTGVPGAKQCLFLWGVYGSVV